MAFTLPEGATPVERISLEANPSVPCIALHLARYCWAATQIPPNSTVSDIACGTGYGSNLLASIPAIVVGVDIDDIAIEEASSKFKQVEHKDGRTIYVSDSAEHFLCTQRDDAYDWVVCFETLEHVNNLGIIFEELLRVCKYGLCFSVPHDEPDDSWRWHKTFGIKRETIENLILDHKGCTQTSFFGQSPQPQCQILPYYKEASDLLGVVKKRR